MVLILVIVALALLAAGVSFALTSAPGVEADLIDPVVQEKAVRRSIRHHPRVQLYLQQRLDRTTAGGFMITVAFAVMFTSALFIGVILAIIDNSAAVQRADRAVSAWGSDHATAASIDAIEFVTQLGSTWFVTLLLVAVATFDYARRRNPEVFLFVLAVGLGELVLNNAIKVIVHRDRPDVLQLVGVGGFSFPSGHSAAAAAAWSAAALVLGRGRPRHVRAALGAVAALVAIAVASSRALLGVHWLTDVIAGLALGWGWFILVAVVFGGRAQRLGDPAARIALGVDDDEHDRVAP